MIYRLKNLMDSCNSVAAEINGNWVPARPIDYLTLKRRFIQAWLAFTGKCDLIRWPEGQ